RRPRADKEMIIQQFFKLLMKIIMAFQTILTGFYFFAFGWKVSLISIAFLLLEVFLYWKKAYNNVEISYVAFNIFTTIGMCISIFAFGNELGFEYYSWLLLCGALFVPFTKDWKIRSGICLASIVLWELIVFTEVEPLLQLEADWERMFLWIYNDIYIFVIFSSFAYVNERYLRKSENNLEKSRHIANYDHLTQLLNRRGLEESFNEKEDGKAAIALCDIDDFKKVNDRYGHNAGDIVLQEISRAFLRFAGADRIVRWGGEEILVYMENASIEVAEKKLNRILCYLRERQILDEAKDLRVTFTAGITEIQSRSELDAGVKKADALLYKGKKNGKNQVVAEKNG
ncbi:MAG: GGDEF domain-containing protein, partial [Acetivibrio ethanolgignens]